MANSITALQHEELIEIINLFGYELSKEGVCFGLSHMAMQAIEAGQINKFDKRLNDLAKLYNAQFTAATKQTFKAFEEENLKFTRDDLQNPESISYKLFYERFRTNHHMNMINYIAKLPDQDRYDLIAFFDGIASYQEPKVASELLSPAKTDYALPSNILPILSPASLDVVGGIKSCTPLSGNFDITKLTKVLSEIQASFANASDCPKSFVIRNKDHALTIGYDPKKQEWYFVDANNLPVRIANNMSKLSELTLRAFENESTQFLILLPYFLKDDETTYVESLATIQNNILLAHNESTSLEQAHHLTESKMVSALINLGEDVNSVNKKGNSLLHLAVMQKNKALCKTLAQLGADIHLKNNDNLSPLEMTEGGIIKVLLLEVNAKYLLEKIKVYIATHKWELGGFNFGKEIQLNDKNKIIVPSHVKAQWDTIKEAESGSCYYEDALKKVLEIGHAASTSISFFRKSSTAEYYKHFNPDDKEALEKLFTSSINASVIDKPRSGK